MENVALTTQIKNLTALQKLINNCVCFWMTSREERTTVASFSPRNKVLVEIKYTRPRIFSGELAELYQGLSQQQSTSQRRKTEF